MRLMRTPAVVVVGVALMVNTAAFLTPCPIRSSLIVASRGYTGGHLTKRTWASPGHPHQSRSCLLLARAGNEGDGKGSSQGENRGIYGFEQEVVDREIEGAPFRKVRLVTFGIFAATAMVLGGLSLAGMAGVDGVKDLSENLPNPLLDLGVLGTTYYLWVEEVKTKRSALKIVERQLEKERKVPNRSDRRNRAIKQKTAKPNVASRKKVRPPPIPEDQTNVTGKVKGASKAAVTASTKESIEADTEKVVVEEGSKDTGGLFAGLKRTLEDVNQLSYAQAVALNRDLEERGVLPPVKRSTDISTTEEVDKEGGGEDGKATVVIGGDGVAVEEIDAFPPTTVVEAVIEDVDGVEGGGEVSGGRDAGTRNKTRKGKKGKKRRGKEKW
ncbi:unnamed protein product [Choristocarpus tenellus]